MLRNLTDGLTFVSFLLIAQSKEWVELQVLEMSPDMTRMGDSLVSASDLLTAHEDVLKKLQVFIIQKTALTINKKRETQRLIFAQHVTSHCLKVIFQIEIGRPHKILLRSI